jgi:hypothetical protein
MCLRQACSLPTSNIPVQRSGGQYLILLLGHKDLADVFCHMTVPSILALYLCRGVEVNISYYPFPTSNIHAQKEWEVNILYCCGDMRILQTCFATRLSPSY